MKVVLFAASLLVVAAGYFALLMYSLSMDWGVGVAIGGSNMGTMGLLAIVNTVGILLCDCRERRRMRKVAPEKQNVITAAAAAAEEDDAVVVVPRLSLVIQN
jgi:hypothetical protein